MGARGVLCAVVGPSGVGKDTLMDGARAALDGRGFHFARRVITRPASAGGEAHEAVDASAFAALSAQGAFALAWAAHGLHYGVRVAALARLGEGEHVIVNVSRTVLDDLRAMPWPLRVFSIRASSETLAQRLRGRGRENAAEIEGRVARAAAFEVRGADVLEIYNDGTPAEGIARFVAALQGLTTSAR